MKKITGKWEDPYICELGISDHLAECNQLLSMLRVAKNTGTPTDIIMVRGKYNNELADLYLILDKYLNPQVIRDRRLKFKGHE